MLQAIAVRSEFAAALALAHKVADRRATIPVLANLALVERDGVLSISATDLDRDLTIRLPNSPADRGFGTTINAYSLRDAEKRAPAGEEITIDDIGGDRAVIRFNKLRVSMPTISEGDFPRLDSPHAYEARFTVARGDIRAMLEKVAFAISTEETRYYLNGIYMHATETGLRFVATDGHRLALHEMPLPDGASPNMPGVIIPRAACGLLADLCKAKGIGEEFAIEVNPVRVRFSIGEAVLTSKVIDGTFPDYERVIPRRNSKSLSVNVAEMAVAIDAVSTISSERGRAVKLAIGAGEVTFSVNNPDAGEASYSIPCEFDGEPGFEIGLNSRYALDILGKIDGERVTLSLEDNCSPVRLDDGASTFVLMPMRV